MAQMLANTIIITRFIQTFNFFIILGYGKSRGPEIFGPFSGHDWGGDSIVSGAEVRQSRKLPGVRRPPRPLLRLGRQII